MGDERYRVNRIGRAQGDGLRGDDQERPSAEISHAQWRSARFHTDQTPWQAGEELDHLGPAQLSASTLPAVSVSAVDLKDILRQIEPYRRNRLHGQLLYRRLRIDAIIAAMEQALTSLE